MLNLVYTRECDGRDAGVFTFIEGMSSLLSDEVRCYCNKRFFDLFRIWLMNRKSILSIHNIWSLGSLILLLCARPLGRKILIFPHGMCEPWALNTKNKELKSVFLWVIKLFSNSKTVFVCLSQLESDNLQKYFSSDSIIVLDPYVYSGSSKTIKNNERINVLFLGRLDAKKGIFELLSVVNQLPDKIVLHICGFGSEDLIQEIINMCRNNKNIVFHGELHGRDKWCLYERCEALILPTHSENFGYVVPEALSSGCIILTTRNTPWYQYMGNKDGFILVDTVSGKGILDAFNKLKILLDRSEDKGKSIFLENRSFYMRSFSRNVVSQKYKDVFV